MALESVQMDPNQDRHVADELSMCTALMPFTAPNTQLSLLVMLHQGHNSLK